VRNRKEMKIIATYIGSGKGFWGLGTVKIHECENGKWYYEAHAQSGMSLVKISQEKALQYINNQQTN
jgi:hypothetical protein